VILFEWEGLYFEKGRGSFENSLGTNVFIVGGREIDGQWISPLKDDRLRNRSLHFGPGLYSLVGMLENRVKDPPFDLSICFGVICWCLHTPRFRSRRFSSSAQFV